MIVSLVYDSFLSDIATISPALQAFGAHITHTVGDIVFANQYPRIPTGETTTTTSTDDESGTTHAPATPASQIPKSETPDSRLERAPSSSEGDEKLSFETILGKQQHPRMGYVMTIVNVTTRE